VIPLSDPHTIQAEVLRGSAKLKSDCQPFCVTCISRLITPTLNLPGVMNTIVAPGIKVQLPSIVVDAGFDIPFPSNVPSAEPAGSNASLLVSAQLVLTLMIHQPSSAQKVIVR
jgi:hypothetical protein